MAFNYFCISLTIRLKFVTLFRCDFVLFLLQWYSKNCQLDWDLDFGLVRPSKTSVFFFSASKNCFTSFAGWQRLFCINMNPGTRAALRERTCSSIIFLYTYNNLLCQVTKWVRQHQFQRTFHPTPIHYYIRIDFSHI